MKFGKRYWTYASLHLLGTITITISSIASVVREYPLFTTGGLFLSVVAGTTLWCLHLSEAVPATRVDKIGVWTIVIAAYMAIVLVLVLVARAMNETYLIFLMSLVVSQFGCYMLEKFERINSNLC